MPEPEPLHDPKAEYARRREARRRVVEHHERMHVRLGNLRLAVAISAAVLAWVAFIERRGPVWPVAVPSGFFIVLVIVHERMLRDRSKAERAERFYQRGLDRLDNRWMGKGESGDRFLDESHPYAQDLDIFGKGSLFELLSTARTRAGEETLARWLLAPGTLTEIRDRHAAIEELRNRLDLREDLALLGEEVRAGIDSEPLPLWGEQPPLLDSTPLRVVAALLSLAALASFIAWAGFGVNARVFLVVLTVEAVVGIYLRRRVLAAAQAVEHPAHDLNLLAEVLVRLERETFTSPKLTEIRRALDTDSLPPSRQIARLNRLIELLDSRDNVAVRLIGPPLMWTTQLAFAVEAWRKHTGPAVRRWIAAVGEMGALSSLAGYAYEHPSDPFPEFTESGAVLAAEGITHPLLAEDRAVRNDIRLGENRVLIVSGSNMSGKSTLLRTVGANAVLAMAGAPVRAQKMQLTPLVVGASIRVTDSLQGGSSRFYAEILRLRRLLDLTKGPWPLLFLLDELLHGTNSHDRRIGAEAVVRSLVERNAVGLITTHDLALATISETLGSYGMNVHFEDHFEEGRITFDYKVRPGVVEKSNALDLMRSVGLEV